MIGVKIYLFLTSIMFSFFRTSADEDYHRAIAYHPSDYKPLLSLMQNKSSFFSSQGRSCFVDEEIDNLEFMTGIKFDI